MAHRAVVMLTVLGRWECVAIHEWDEHDLERTKRRLRRALQETDVTGEAQSFVYQVGGPRDGVKLYERRDTLPLAKRKRTGG